MSEPGDVVWADGVAWQRDDDYVGDTEKQRWLAPAAPTGAGHKTLKELKEFQDFRWLVKNGAPIDAIRPSVAASPETSIPVGSHRLENSDEVIYNAHDPKFCEGSPCVIHNLTDHHMRSWQQHYREDNRLMERICTHGVGHPDPDLPDQGDKVHGCDGCCVESTAPTRGGYSPGYEAYQFQISNLFELLAQAEKERDYYSKAASTLAKERFDLEARIREIAEVRDNAIKAREMFQDDYDKVVADRNLVINELAAMTKMRDAARKDAQEAVAGHEKLVEYYTVDFPRRMSNNKELRDLRQRCSDLGEENEQLSSALNDERRVGRQDERAAIVKWLNEDPQGWVRHWSLAGRLERGVHLGGDDE